MSARLRSAVPVISRRENSIAGMCCAGLGRYPDEYLSTSSALAQDVATGETSFRKCLPCHAIGTVADASNKTGPLLNGIEGRKRKLHLHPERGDLSGLHQGPESENSRHQKLFAGIKGVTEASNLWAYLRQFGPYGRPKWSKAQFPCQRTSSYLTTRPVISLITRNPHAFGCALRIAARHSRLSIQSGWVS